LRSINILIVWNKKGAITNCSNYRDISLLPTTFKILSNILLSRLPPYAEELNGDHQCGFQHNRSTAYHIFCIRQILEKKRKNINEAVHQLFVDCNKAYDSVRREVLYNILIQFGIHMKLVGLIKMFLNETYSRPYNNYQRDALNIQCITLVIIVWSIHDARSEKH